MRGGLLQSMFSGVCQSVSLSLCLRDFKRFHRTNTAERIEVLLGAETIGVLWNIVLDGS